MVQAANSEVKWMSECLRLAKKGEGAVSPNPMVGAVLVRKGQVLARGFHRQLGGAHAEIECFRRLKGTAKGATLYVNLEPCTHYGKTPPCTDRILESGVRSVVIGMKDPNPLVSGKGIRALQRSGIKVKAGILERECRDLNRAFVRHIATGLPFVHLKVAQTLDGKIAGLGGKRQWISSLESRRMVHSWRATHDAVLVGATTVLSDDPLLSVRMTKGRNPHVIIVDGKLRVPLKARALRADRERHVVVCTAASAVRRNPRKVRSLRQLGVQVLEFREHRGRIPLRQVLRRLYQQGVGSVLVEGGSDIFGGFLYGGFVDQFSLFLSPNIMGKGLQGFDTSRYRKTIMQKRLEHVAASPIGKDMLIQYFFS